MKLSNKLSTVNVEKLGKGRYSDGNGLYLQITASGGKSWLFRFMLNRRSRTMGLGSFASVSLEEARALAAAAKRLRKEGIDPIEERNGAEDDL